MAGSTNAAKPRAERTNARPGAGTVVTMDEYYRERSRSANQTPAAYLMLAGA
jgi:hypothetical protein